MKTKRTTKPTANARLRERIIALEVNHESLCESLRMWKQGVDEEMATRIDKLEHFEARAQRHFFDVDDRDEKLCERVAVLENSSAQVCRLASGSPRVERGDPIVIDTPEPVIPEGWKRVTFSDALIDGHERYYGFYRLKGMSWSNIGWWFQSGPTNERIYLARDYPELPADVTAAGWVACEWEEAQEMGGGERAGVWLGSLRPPKACPWSEGETDITWIKLEPKK